MAGANSLLIIDDDVLTADLYQNFLEKAGYNVIIANTTGEATDVLAGIEVDAVVLDYDLPDGNGLAWLRELREFEYFAHLPVILVSSIQRQDDLTQDDYVWFMEKPRQPQQIVTAVQSTIAQFT